MTPDSLSQGQLEKLQRDTFSYFKNETNLENGLVPDNTRQDSPCSITAVGLALAAYTVGVERGFLTRAEAIERTLTTLRFFWNSPQSDAPDATGYKGFYYHFLDMNTGRRVWQSELSTIDSTYLLAGALAAAAYFDHDTDDEAEIRHLADSLYSRADWQWALNGGLTVSHGWRPEKGFIRYRWEGYNEAILLYILALGSPTYPLTPESYQAWTRTYEWRELYGYEFLYCGPLFTHQLSHVWIDFRGIQDDYMRARNLDYFENSRRATYVQQAYAMHNPKGFKGYHEYCWGITASDGPGDETHHIDGVERRFYGYKARAVPDGPDDGTIAPWAATTSLPFAPEIVLPTLAYIDDSFPTITSKYGFKCSFNPTFPANDSSLHGWMSQGYFALDQGPIVLMIENYLTDFFWRLMSRCPYLVTGLRRAGFSGTWLD
jgi:hypothetical protein